MYSIWYVTTRKANLRGVSISFTKKELRILVEVSALNFFWMFTIIFYINWFQSDLWSNCGERSPEVYQLRSSQQKKNPNGSKLHPTKSVLDPLRTIKRKERSRIYFMKKLWWVFLLWFTHEIQNQCHPFGPMSKTLENFCPHFCHFLILLYNFV